MRYAPLFFVLATAAGLAAACGSKDSTTVASGPPAATPTDVVVIVCWNWLRSEACAFCSVSGVIASSYATKSAAKAPTPRVTATFWATRAWP